MEQDLQIPQFSALEWRCMWMTSDGSDTGRQITNFVTDQCSATIDYLLEGLRRIAEKWATARQRWGEVAKHELEAEFEKIQKGAWKYAEDQFTEWAKDAADGGNLKSFQEMTEIQEKMALTKRSHRWRC